MPDKYKYKLAECDVPIERSSALEAYRAKRETWLSWISTDEHHAIWSTLHSMVWTDVAFKTLTSFGANDDENPLNNTLMVEVLLNGHVATQVLAIRRLMDKQNISLRRLVTEVKSKLHLITRENYVCYDGLPYDYCAALEARFETNAKNQQRQPGVWTWVQAPLTEMPSRLAHNSFDKLSGVDPSQRKREDSLPRLLITTLEKWLKESGADNLKEWSHAYLAHAGDSDRRKDVAHLQVTANEITKAIKGLVRVTEAISALLLFAESRSNELMPFAQFDVFEKLDRAVMQPGQQDAASQLWKQLSIERNAYLNEVEAELIGKPAG